MNPMPLSLSIGPLELVTIALVIIPTAVLVVRGHRISRYLIGTSISMAVATILTPADPFSTIALALLLFVMFATGVKTSVSGSKTVSRRTKTG